MVLKDRSSASGDGQPISGRDCQVQSHRKREREGETDREREKEGYISLCHTFIQELVHHMGF